MEVSNMRKYLFTLICFILLAVVSGCTTIYKTAVDERSIGTIARDTKIKTVILKRFIDDKNIKTLDIFAASYDGNVYLIGEYETLRQKNEAVEIARGVEGVKNVTTYMLLKKKDGPCGTKVNLKLTAKTKGKLIKDKSIWSTNVDVKTVQCNVVLVGLVGSKEEIKKAVDHAKSVEGIKSVKSFLKAIK
jgi:hyperosmotically inducible protein